ncbi:DUF371 domain-containing protein [Halorhabdus rudnickae]|uniref:DUF371 domain-containing protein n=1 Tax=Halorhabdus rudnickae TaxID=1775544 RepID=UPI001083C417|nr:DUF371 domain-containing protein [Halorhabdus rudnickae]
MDERIRARGDDNVTATHQSTLELTSDDYLTPAGDCIVGIEADRVPADFDPGFVEACQDRDSQITATLSTDSHQFEIIGRGHPDLTFENDRSLVLRTSDYVDDRTVMIDADAAAADVDRDLIEALSAGESVTMTLAVE